MDILQKKLLGWAGLALMVLAGVYLTVITGQASNTATTTNTVSFSGEGKVMAKPDIALVDLSIVTQSSTSKTAQNDNSKKSTAVIDALKKIGIAEKDIKTTSYNISPQYTSAPCPRGSLCPVYGGATQISSYQVSETVQVKVRDIAKVDDVLAGVVSAGANQVNQVQLTIDNPEKLKDDARAQAIADAEQKAKKLQSQLGVRLGHIINFTENGNGNWPSPIYLKAQNAADSAGALPAIASGENEITVDVTVTYQIK